MPFRAVAMILMMEKRRTVSGVLVNLPERMVFAVRRAFSFVVPIRLQAVFVDSQECLMLRGL